MNKTNHMPYSARKRTRRVLVLKSFREQDKQLFAEALVRAVREAALEHRYNDGFVEWFLVSDELDDWLDELGGDPSE